MVTEQTSNNEQSEQSEQSEAEQGNEASTLAKRQAAYRQGLDAGIQAAGTLTAAHKLGYSDGRSATRTVLRGGMRAKDRAILVASKLDRMPLTAPRYDS